MPPKIYHGPEEPPIGDDDRRANASLAGWLFEHALRGKPGRTLDIGCKEPVLAAALFDRGCKALATDAGAPNLAAHGLPILCIDFEADDPALGSLVSAKGPFDLVTLVHVFEHFERPLDALRKLRGLVAEDGRVFLRLPDHTVGGFERDLTAHHYAIHPYFHCLASIAEALAQLRDAFVIETQLIPGPGQRDLILRPITAAPTICLGMIVKNEERDLPRCLASVTNVIDAAVIIDTGSTDRTLDVARECLTVPVYARTCTAHSKQDAAGDWRLRSFAAARNSYVREIRERGFDWLFWMDADDELLSPQSIRRATYMPPAAYAFPMDLGGGQSQVHYRLWPAQSAAHFKGWCHEYPVLDDLSHLIITDAKIRHDATPHGNETSNARNLRILMEEWAAEPSPRCAFYIANTHRDGGRHKEAIEWYRVRISKGVGFRDEYLFALLYMARSHLDLEQIGKAEKALRQGRDMAPDWMEFRMGLANAAYRDKDYAACIALCLPCLDAPQPPTLLWREVPCYTDASARLISWCHEHTGDIAEALEWAMRAADRIGAEDADWNARIRTLRARLAPVAQKRLIVLVRPGAIGDVLMTLNLVPHLVEANPDAVIHYLTAFARHDELGGMIEAAGAVPVLIEELPVALGRADRVINLVGYPLHEGYPEKPMRQHLLRYFAAEMGVELPAEGLPALALPLPSVKKDANYATLQVKAGWSQYKNWPLERWADVVKAIPDIPVFQIGKEDEPLIPGCEDARGQPLQTSIALVANAQIHIGIDSFANHLTNFHWTTPAGARRVPGVILWGSTQPSAAGYPDNVNLYANPPCGPCFREDPAVSKMPRGPCVTLVETFESTRDGFGALPACMADIKTAAVIEAVRGAWERAR